MFFECTDITEIDLSNFDTSKVNLINDMFHGCNFDTSQVTSMYYMFYNCSSLTSLNLSNFETSKVKDIYNMFDGCINLEYINMINFN